MTLKSWAYIFISPNFKQDRTEISSSTCKVQIIGLDINNKEAVIPLAKELVAQGAQLIELCGGFGPLWIARIIEATEGKIPVGGVMYGPEARKPMLDLLS